MRYFILDEEPTAEQLSAALGCRKAISVEKWLVKTAEDVDGSLFTGDSLTSAEARAVTAGSTDWNGPNPGET